VKWYASKASTSTAKTNNPVPTPIATLWKERQLRDFRKANDLCYFCGGEVCTRPSSEVYQKGKTTSECTSGKLGVELTDDTPNQLATEDALLEEMGQLSLNAIARTDNGYSMRIRALVQNKVVLILVDSGRSHSFISQSFVSRVGIHTSTTTALQVKVANGETLKSCQQVQ
jgi:hypothetical protein